MRSGWLHALFYRYRTMKLAERQEHVDGEAYSLNFPWTWKAAGDPSMIADLSVAPSLGDGDGHVFGMDIVAQIHYFLAHQMGDVDCSFLGSSGSGSTPLPNTRIGLARSSPQNTCSQCTSPFSSQRAAFPTCSRKPGRSHKVSAEILIPHHVSFNQT